MTIMHLVSGFFNRKLWVCSTTHRHSSVLNYIRTTTTATGLTVSARLLHKKYAKGEEISKQQMEQLLNRHTTLPAWNYTLTPETM
jgi:hypothetical protein